MLNYVFIIVVFALLLLIYVESKECKGGYFYFESTDSCYGRSFNYIGQWKDAEENCQKEDGHLASIHSKEEAGFISDIPIYGSNQMWIGLSNHGGKWRWSDETKFDFASWDADPSGEFPKCVVFHDGIFFEVECEEVGKFHFSICKKAPLEIKYTLL